MSVEGVWCVDKTNLKKLGLVREGVACARSGFQVLCRQGLRFEICEQERATRSRRDVLYKIIPHMIGQLRGEGSSLSFVTVLACSCCLYFVPGR